MSLWLWINICPKNAGFAFDLLFRCSMRCSSSLESAIIIVTRHVHWQGAKGARIQKLQNGSTFVCPPVSHCRLVCVDVCVTTVSNNYKINDPRAKHAWRFHAYAWGLACLHIICFTLWHVYNSAMRRWTEFTTYSATADAILHGQPHQGSR